MSNFEWTPERKEIATKLADQGWTRSKIAMHFGCSRNAIGGLFNRIGYRDNGLFWTEERRKQAVEMTDEGLTSAQVGEQLGCSGRAVLGILFRIGHKRGRPAPKPERKRVFRFGEVVKTRPEVKQPQIIAKGCFKAGDRVTVPIWNLGVTQCKWPFDPVEDGDLVTYCGEETGDIDRPFCPVHTQLAYRPLEGKPKDEKVQPVRRVEIARPFQPSDFES